MLVTNHVLSGAAVGAAIGRPLPAFAAGVVSHFALDALPHWGIWRDEQHFFRVAVIDGLAGLTAMAAVTKLAAGSAPLRLAIPVVAGMVGAALPDMDKPSAILLKRRLWPERVNQFHARIQDEAPHRFYSHEVVGGVVFATAAAVLIRRLGR